jgi:hypothetical protein
MRWNELKKRTGFAWEKDALRQKQIQEHDGN